MKKQNSRPTNNPLTMRIKEANTFLKAFQNKSANQLVQKILKNNYSEAIIEHHPNVESIDKDLVHMNCNNLVEDIFGQIEKLTLC